MNDPRSTNADQHIDATFRAEGRDLDALRDLLPQLVKLGSTLAALPIPQWALFGYVPWGRFNRVRVEVAAVDAGDDELLNAFINEVQPTGPVIAMTFRRVLADGYAVGPWRVPQRTHIMIGISLVQTDPRLFEAPDTFRPERFLGKRADPYALIPFGGGVRRCIGAAFAHMELQVVLRTLLSAHVLKPTNARGEAWKSRGVAFAPADGGQIVRHSRHAARAAV